MKLMRPKRCKKCGKELSLLTVIPSIQRRYGKFCRSCSMIGNQNKKGKFTKDAKKR